MSRPEDRVVIRALPQDDWSIHRRIRLAALRTNPEAFGSTLERNEAFDEDEWRRRTHHLSWFAFVDGEPAGMVQLWFERDTKPVPEVVALWVDPRARRQGVAQRLMCAAVTAALELAERTDLWVVETNWPARRLYDELGFDLAGRSRPGSCGGREIQMCIQRPL